MTLPSSGPLSLNDIQGEFGGSNPIGINEYYAGGGLVPAGTSGTYGAVPTSGQISIQNFYGTSNFVPVYIEDVFSTWLYTGNYATQTITNGIDLAGKGGLVWIKDRTTAQFNLLFDTSRGANYWISSNNTNASAFNADMLQSFNSNGFGVGTTTSVAGSNYASWTFRKQPKFFDVVTYTGNGARNRNISHSLGSAPGFILIKRTSAVSNWSCWHRSLGTNNYLLLNSTASNSTANINPSQGATYGGYIVTSSSTTFSVSTDDTNTGDPTTGENVNANGSTYVAYLFAHNAGGFGLTGTDNVISCGSFTADGSGNATVNLGYEPQWVLYKPTTSVSNWQIIDNMRGFSQTSATRLFPNTSGAEFTSSGNFLFPTATGFQGNGIFNPSDTLIYIAIRRGPMKTPTSGTSVFEPLTHAGTSTTRSVSTSFPSDFLMVGVRNATSARFTNTSRLTANKFMWTGATNAENSNTSVFPTNVLTSTQNAFTLGDSSGNDWVNASGNTYVDYNFRRAPGFFDVVCYTGTGSTTTFSHNLGVAPELMIVKNRADATGWQVYHVALGATKGIQLQATAAAATSSAYWNDTSPNSSVFTVGTSVNTNESGFNLVAYLFASCPGVSKVGSYSGTGATQTISCGFAARFVLIKRTDSTGNWWVWDTARGMVAGTDPRLPMNAVTIESNADWVYTNASGFQIVTTDATVNASGGTYIYLAIA